MAYIWAIIGIPINSTPGMMPNTAPPNKGASSCVSRNSNVKNNMGLLHIDLTGRHQRSRLSNNNSCVRFFRVRAMHAM